MLKNNFLWGTSFLVLCSQPLLGISLEEAIQKALEANPNILADQFAQSSAKEGIGVARSTLFPSLDVQNRGGYDYVHTKSKSAFPYSISAHAHTSRRVNNASVTLSQIIFDGFDTLYKIRESESGFEQATQQLGLTQEQVAFDVCRVFYTIQGEDDLIRISQDSIKKHKEILDMVKKRVKGGIGTRADVEQVESRLKDAEVALISSQAEKDKSIAEFISLVGVFPDKLVETPLPLDEIPAALDEILEEVSHQNPSVKVALKQMDVASAQYERSKAPFYPSITFQSSASENINPSGQRSKNGDVTAVGIVSYNIFSGGKNISEKRAQQEHLSEVKQKVAAARWATEKDTRLAWTDWKSSKERILELNKAININKKLSDDYTIQFRLVDRNLLDILDAYNDYYRSQAAKANSVAQEKINAARLLFNISALVKAPDTE
ncbi:TolC family protein [Candidatus Bealeia paramacronuclearis]|uniref:TolC family protein n=1 Tax=Candidatus Bealeia paramacronuclearis TaxID=1921001 RepID=A0ABZ2C0S9_9PROT|nr:TolC family protein [Candidatus Bealeia paramacronuclearis]